MSTPSIFSAIQKIRYLLTRKEKITSAGMACLALGTSLLEVMTTSLIVVLAQTLVQPERGQHILSKLGFAKEIAPECALLYITLSVGAAYLIKNVVAAAEIIYQNFAIQKMHYNCAISLLRKYATAAYGFYLTRNASEGLRLIENDTELMFLQGMISFALLFSEGMVFLFLISLIVYMDPSLALCIFGIGLVLSIGITKGLLPRLYRWGQRVQEADVHGFQHLLQFFHGFKDIILLGKKDVFIALCEGYAYQKSRITCIQKTISTLPRFFIEILFVSMFVCIIAFLCIEHDRPIEMMGLLGGYLYIGFRLMPGLNRIISHLNTFKSVIPSIERVYDAFNIMEDRENYRDFPSFVFQKVIKLDNVSYRYKNTEKDVLKGVSLEIKRGECIGIIGETGSGKSTLVDLILGLLRPDQGSIFVDHEGPVNSQQWHKKIGYVPQAVYLTDDTIEANIGFGEQEIDEARLNAAIDAAQLRPFMAKLSEAGKTLVGERGVRLSGGERQRIAIARALYRNPEVLIFDEATSSLDNETESRLMETIHAVSQNRTVIMIAHRLTTLKNCDRIIIMEEGKIKQVVRYEDILQDKDKLHG